MDFFLGFKQHFALLVFAAADRFVDDAFGLFLRAADFLFGDLLAIGNAENEENHTADDKPCRDAKEERDQIKFHNLRTHLLITSIGLR